MLSREKILEILDGIATEKTQATIEELSNKINMMSDDKLHKALEEQKIKTVADVKKFVKKRIKPVRTEDHKFIELNELVSYGFGGQTVHIHVVPKDARSLLTREGFKKAELALIDATEKLKVLMETDSRYKKVENIYAVSGIITGPVARWFRNIGYDVKTLVMNDAKKDEELKVFVDRFKEQPKLGRAILSKQKLLSEEWENIKEERKNALVPNEKMSFIHKLQELKATDQEVISCKENYLEESQRDTKKEEREEI